MLTPEERAALWTEMTRKEQEAMIADHVELFAAHVMHRRAERIRVRHRRPEVAFPVGVPAPLPAACRPNSWSSRVYAVLLDAEDWLTRAEIAERMGATDSRSWHSGLRALMDHGLIVEGPARAKGYRKSQTLALRRD